MREKRPHPQGLAPPELPGARRKPVSSKALHGDENVTREVIGINLLEDEAAGEF